MQDPSKRCLLIELCDDTSSRKSNITSRLGLFSPTRIPNKNSSNILGSMSNGPFFHSNHSATLVASPRLSSFSPLQATLLSNSFSPSKPDTSSTPSHNTISTLLVLDKATPSLKLVVDLPLRESKSSHPMVTWSKQGIFKKKLFLFDSTISENGEHIDVSAALHFPLWLKAMEDEFQALQRNKAWTLVSPQPIMNVVGNEWVSKLKQNSDGYVQSHKARLV